MSEADKPKWGVYDTVDKCWMGTEKGPNEYPDDNNHFDASAAATIINEMFQCGPPHKTPYRFLPRPLSPKPFQLRDTIEAPVTPERAIKTIEDRV